MMILMPPGSWLDVGFISGLDHLLNLGLCTG